MTGITSDEETKNSQSSKTTTCIASLFHDSKDGQPLPRKVAKKSKKAYLGYSQIWLNLTTDDCHFFYIFL